MHALNAAIRAGLQAAGLLAEGGTVLECAGGEKSFTAGDRAWKARLIRRTRTGLGLSQTEFARRFCVPPGTLRDWEQVRSSPPDFAIAYVKVIAHHPDMVAEEVA